MDARPTCTSFWSSPRFTGTPATPGGPAWRRARSCTSSGRSASRSTKGGAARRARLLAACRARGSGPTGRRSSRAAVAGRALPVHGARPARFQDVAYAKPAVLIFGRESVGLDPRFSRATRPTRSQSRCSIRAAFAQPSTSVALALYEVRRQRGWSGGAAGLGRDVERARFELRRPADLVARPIFSSSRIVYQPKSICSGVQPRRRTGAAW